MCLTISNIKKHFVTTLALVSLAITVGSAEAKELKAAVPVPVDTVWGKAFAEYASIVEKNSNGDLTVRIIGPEAIPAEEQPNALKTGLLDILTTYPAAYKGLFVEANVQEISNVPLDEQRNNGAYEKLNSKIGNVLNAELLATYGAQVPFHLYLNEDIQSEGDLDGQRVRSSVLANAFLGTLSVQQVNVPIPETYTALERKLVNGYFFTVLGIKDLGWDKMTKVRVDPGFYHVIFNVLLSNKTREILSDEEISILVESAKEFENKIDADLTDQVEKEYERQAEMGIKSVDFGSAFADRARQVYWDDLTKDSEMASEFRALMDQ